MSFISKLNLKVGCYQTSRFLPVISQIHRNLANKSSIPDKFTPADPKTHTGQAFGNDDYRMVRFVDKSKQINERFAIDLIDSVPPKKESKRVVSCDGGGGPIGHPKVYINLDAPGNHTCGYCGLRFYKDSHH